LDFLEVEGHAHNVSACLLPRGFAPEKNVQDGRNSTEGLQIRHPTRIIPVPVVPSIVGAPVGAVGAAVEGAVMDLHIGTRCSINSSALEVGCPPPGYGEISGHFSENSCFGTTYKGSSVALEGGVVDLHICTATSTNSTPL
jgi:hypothetical protein